MQMCSPTNLSRGRCFSFFLAIMAEQRGGGEFSKGKGFCFLPFLGESGGRKDRMLETHRRRGQMFAMRDDCAKRTYKLKRNRGKKRREDGGASDQCLLKSKEREYAYESYLPRMP